MNKLKKYAGGAIWSLPEKVHRVFDSSSGVTIRDFDRQLLALRGYFRNFNRINRRWPNEAGTASANFTSGRNRIIRAFGNANQGFRIRGNANARTLEEQVRLWNGNDTVAGLGADLRKKAISELSKPTYSEAYNTEHLERFREWLGSVHISWRRPGTSQVFNSPSNATPGLSSHGVFRAIDFVVINRSGQVVAGTNTRRTREIWDDPGWTQSLRQAVRSVDPQGTQWDGPLTAGRLYEPWHYTYIGD